MRAYVILQNMYASSKKKKMALRRAFHYQTAKCLFNIGFHMADAYYSLFLSKSSKCIMLFTTYVDDLSLLAFTWLMHITLYLYLSLINTYCLSLVMWPLCGRRCQHAKNIEGMKSLCRKKFDMKDWRDLGFFLGNEVISMQEEIWFFSKAI